MKKWISYFLFGTLVLSSFLAAGTSIKDQRKAQSALDTSVNHYTPILIFMKIIVADDGTFEGQTICGPDDWTGEIHNATFRVTIINPYNNTGSTIFFWRLAEYPDTPMAWFIFWLTHGNARPTIPQILVSKLVVKWSTDDDNITIKDYTISVEINQDEPFEIRLFLYVPPFSKSGCSYQYTPVEI